MTSTCNLLLYKALGLFEVVRLRGYAASARQPLMATASPCGLRLLLENGRFTHAG